MLRKAILAAACAAVLASNPAEACECAAGPEIVLPRDGAADVPLNARVLVSAEKVGEGKWVGADTTAPAPRIGIAPIDKKGAPGAGVPVAITTMLSEAYGTVFVVKPKKPLKASTQYALVKLGDKKKKEKPVAVATFTTGTAADGSSPVFAGIERFTAVVAYTSRTKCSAGDPPYRQISWEHGQVTDDLAKPEDLVRILYVQRKGEERTVRLIEPAAHKGATSLTGSVCDPFKAMFDAGEEVCATVEIVDLAGNAAGANIEKCMLAKKF
jgi:hypothetical protein